MRLSHSSKEKYLTCSKKWQLYYQEKLKSTLIGSALFFGSAFDDALTRILLEKKKVLTEEETELMKLSEHDVFIKSFSEVDIAKELVSISNSSQAMYYKSDFDITLLEAKDYLDITKFGNEVEIELKGISDVQEFFDECQLQFKKGKVDNDTQRMYNYICWLSLRNKGLMLLDAYRVQVFPEIEEVFEIQKRISLFDGEDEYMGYIDFTCTFKSKSGVKYIVDNKTSSQAYKQDSVSLSEQLASYSEAEDIEHCAFIVVEKKIQKREPRVRCKIIKDKMPSETIDETFGKITEVFNAIKEEKFEKDFDACFQYGRKCEYFDYCRTGELKNLKYTNKEKK